MQKFVDQDVVLDKSRHVRIGKSALRLNQLESERLIAEAAFNSPEATETHKLKLELAHKNTELFFREHDSTGAWKGERFGRDLLQDFQARSWERDQEQQLEISESDERAHLLLINMGELDRLNASGDHSLGDQGLRLSAMQIENIVREVLSKHPENKDERRLADVYDLYRQDGNYFSLSLRDVDPSDAEEIRKRLTQEEVKIDGVKADEDPIPLTASLVSRAEGIRLLNSLESLPAEAGLTEQKFLIKVLLEKAQTMLDVRLIESRAKRMVEKIKNPGLKGEAGARDFYEKFLKKSLGSAFKENHEPDLIGFDSFKNILASKRALEDPNSTEWIHFLTEKSLDSAFESLKSRRSVGRQIELCLAKKVAADVLNKRVDFGNLVDSDQEIHSTPEFHSPLDTRGKEQVVKLQNEASVLQSLRGKDEAADLKADIAQIDVKIEQAKRDQRTGLYGRGIYFETLEKGMEKQPVTNIAIDMAFLRYFDKEGGPAAGDLAILKAAEILDTIANTFTDDRVKLEAFRVGGDEFALTITGGDEKITTAVLETLRTAQLNTGRVPAQPGAKMSYKPEALQFNYGVRSLKDLESFKQELTDANIPLTKTGTPQEQNELAEYMVRLSDKEVEIQKGMNRIRLLLGRTLQARVSGERGNLDTLIAYSQKSIFGLAGERKIEELADRLMASHDRESEMVKLGGEVLAFVIDEIDKKNIQVESYSNSIDRRVEDAVRIRFFESRIGELEEELDLLRHQIRYEKNSSIHLENALAAAEDEKAVIIQLRGRMQDPAAIKKAA